MTTVTPPRPPAPRPTGTRPRTSAVPGTARTLDPFRVLRRHLLLILSSILAGVVLGFVAFVLFFFLLPRYSAQVVFEIRAALDEGFDPTVGDIQRQDLVTRLATTEMYLLVSRPVLEAAVKQPDVRQTTWYREHFEGELDEDKLQAEIDAMAEVLNEQKIERHAYQIVYLVERLIRAYAQLSIDESAIADFVDRLRSVSNDISRRVDGSRYTHWKEHCLSLVDVVGCIEETHIAPNEKDLNNLRNLAEIFKYENSPADRMVRSG